MAKQDQREVDDMRVMRRLLDSVRLCWWTWRAGVLRDSLKRAHLKALGIGDAHKRAVSKVGEILEGVK